MEMYRYCSVQPKGMKTVYAYLSDDEMKVGAFVEIPFGKDNKTVKGVVLEVNEYTADDAPFPVEKTKKIIRIISENEYKAEDIPNDDAYDYAWDDEIAEVEEYIKDNDYDEIFLWACDHHECIESQNVMDKVRSCYEICVEQSNPTAALNLGTLYYNGTSVPQDFVKAAHYYEIAAAAGERRALCNLGYCYYYGRHQEVDYERAYHYFNLCAQLHNDPNCLYKIGDMYQSGKYLEKNDRYAFLLYDRAYSAINNEDEDQFCRADILFRIGKCLVEGKGVNRNVHTGHRLLCMALSGFYERRKTDPFVKGLIDSAKKEIAKAEALMDDEVI